MPTYVSLIKFTQQGAATIKDGPKRLDAARQRFKAAGAELKGFYLLTGQYDAVAISECPNDEVAVKLSMATASQGNIRTETCRAFTEEEYRKMASSL